MTLSIRSLGAWAFAALALAVPTAQAQSLDILLNCSGCHGLQRAADDDLPPRYPVLNGQPARYLAAQLDAFRTGDRVHPQMSLSAQALGPGGVTAMARMYAYAPAPRLRLPKGAEVPDTAVRLNETGAWDRGIAPCATCHSPQSVDGVDMAARTAPRLHGQPRAYLANQLHAYAEGTRKTGPMGRMQAYAERLEADEIEALAAYFAAFEERGRK